MGSSSYLQFSNSKTRKNKIFSTNSLMVKSDPMRISLVITSEVLSLSVNNQRFQSRNVNILLAGRWKVLRWMYCITFPNSYKILNSQTHLATRIFMEKIVDLCFLSSLLKELCKHYKVSSTVILLSVYLFVCRYEADILMTHFVRWDICILKDWIILPSRDFAALLLTQKEFPTCSHGKSEGLPVTLVIVLIAFVIVGGGDSYGYQY